MVVYTSRTITTGGREDGAARSSDGLLDVRLSRPGSARIGTNPEQLFAAAWSASFASAIAAAAAELAVALRAPVAIEAEIDLGPGEGGSLLAARLLVRLPGVEPQVARTLIERARRACPYARATRGNIAVEIKLA